MHVQPVILHAQNTFNNGSFMMLVNLIWYFVKHLSREMQVTFWVELDGPENYERLNRALPEEFLISKGVEIKQLPLKITSVDHSSPFRKAFRLFGKFYRHPAIFEELGINSVIILGGDDISEYYKGWKILSDLYRIRQYSKSFPTILAGQTIGPFKKIREPLAAQCLSKTVIYTRDELSASYLKNRLGLPGPRIHSSADLCFPELPDQEKYAGILTSLGLENDGYITLVPGGFYSLYTRDRSGYIQSWVRLITGLLEQASQQTMRLVLLPHVTRPEDDRVMIRAIHQSLLESGADVDRLCPVEEELLPQQLRYILGKGRLTISSRMHAALSTFQMRKPAIALGYSVKYEGVIGHSLNLPQLVQPCSASLLGDPARFTFEVLNKTQYIEEHYQQLVDHLETRIPQLQEQAEDQIRKICLRDENGS